MCWAVASVAAPLPAYQKVKDRYQASDVLVLDRTEQLLERVRTDFQGRRGDWISLGDISVALQRAVIQSEDQRFYTHEGVDWRAIVAAGWGNVFHQQHRGASTLTMQLLGFIDHEYRRGPNGRGIGQKIDQARQALVMEESWTKPQILEAYLNLAAFRGELIGVDALARVLFQKHPSGLNGREAAIAAVLLRGPNASLPVLRQRSCALLADMGMADECQGLDDFLYQVLKRRSAPRVDTPSLAPHFARLAVGQLEAAPVPGQALPTSLDASLQRFALQRVGSRLKALGMENVRDAAVVVMDNETGQVLAYVGSSGERSTAAQVDHARALRQAGSALKPFLYAQALEEERLTAVSLLDDRPLNLPTGNGLYIPQNYDKRFSGWVSVRTALASSLNIPAVRVLLMVTPDGFARRLVQLGLPLDQSGDFYGYSLALGSADVTLLSLTNAYRVLANSGRYSVPQYFADRRATPKWQQIMSPAAAWIVGNILSDRQARARTFGLDSPLSTLFWTAVKTGTSKDMRDNWCVGWSQRYTVGVWVGNSGGGSMQDVSGVSGAGPIWHDIMSHLHRSEQSAQPPMPSGVASAMVDFQDDMEPSRQDFFIGDSAMRHVALAEHSDVQEHSRPRILSPVSGTILALDPDIPIDKQRVLLKAGKTDRPDGLTWRLGSEVLGYGREVAWTPRPGRHRIQLLDEDGTVLDEVRLESR
ncbi:penicillin-binding protein 1C [Pollutimonas subterranea]|uniref:peptidoglycan glycosyltransferase n=2 Tax=Pollutimonas subterranea TaxID=2045210 RepID=A0A2N4U3F8_9BURK|nr:penicillin-binding protein 1C [Pollutimonas subterranea]